MNDDAYLETRLGKKLTVNWESTVIRYASRVAMYGFMLGSAAGAISVVLWMYPTGSHGLVKAVVIVVGGGFLFAGFFGVIAVIVKDSIFPYEEPYERLRSLPRMAAPSDMKPRPLMRSHGNTMLYGKELLEPSQMLSLAQAIASGEDYISLRKLAEWGVMTNKDTTGARQLKADIERLGYGIQAGNDRLKVTPAFRDYLQDIFPALPPYPKHNGGVLQ